MGAFADAVAAYVEAGWPCVLPVPVATKHPPPVGFTGADGRDTDVMQIVRWAGSHGDSSIALRMPDGVVGFDVDHYDKHKPDGSIMRKRGGDQLAALEAKLGPLPPTWMSTARDRPSGIQFYRVPTGRYVTTLGDSIEVIQRHHRYAVVAPSINPDADGAQYRWWSPGDNTGTLAGLPRPHDFPWLPDPWVAHLREGATDAAASAADPQSGQTLLYGYLMADDRDMCAEMHNAWSQADAMMARADSGSRHDIATARTHHIVQLGASGHAGTRNALLSLGERWAALTAGEAREGEWERLLLTSARKAVTRVGLDSVRTNRDPCLLTTGGELAPHNVGQADNGTPWWSIREIIGVHPWNPLGELDQTLARAVLERTWPVLRYAYDANTWLLRGRERWSARGDLAGWAVAEVAELMPHGDSKAEKGTTAQREAARRSRLQTNAGRNAVASTMRALVAAGTHPSGLELAALDTEPWLLWAGGQAWDLAAGQERPTLAAVDPGTPHLHTAAVAPDAAVQTPLWDRWLAVVWPDPEIRAWALRVLSIALTGYADAALPVLFSKPRSGKSFTVECLLSVLGSYGAPASPQLFNAQRNSATDAIVAELKGLRLAFIDEYHLSVGPRQQELVKRLTGGARLTADAKGQKPITFTPTHTFVVTSNPEPEIADPAIRARVRLIPCEAEEADTYAMWSVIKTNPDQWRAEQPGILAQMMIEAARYLADRQSASVAAGPTSIAVLMGDLANAQDAIGTWLAEETEPHPDGTKASALYQAHAEWCRRMNVPAAAIPTTTAFGTALTGRGYPPQKRRDAFYRLLRVRQFGAPVGVGSWSVGGGIAAEPTTPKNATSTAVSKPSVVGVVGIHTRSTTTTPNTPKHQNGEQYREPTTPTTAPAVSKADKAAARKTATAERKAAERLAKISDAAGVTVPLPAMVDRAGAVTAVTLADADAVLGEIAARTALTVDVETSGYPVGHRDYRLRTVQLGDTNVALVFDATDDAHRDCARRWLSQATKLHAHSATADLVPLAHAGLIDAESGWQRMYDTVVPAKLSDPASTGSDPGLKRLSGAVLAERAVAPGADEARSALWKAGGWLKETKVDTPTERSGWAQVQSNCKTMIRYAASDVLDTAALADTLPWPNESILERERATERIVSRVAHHGLRIDGDAVRALLATETAAMDEARAKVCAAGIDNPGSDAQVGERLTALGAALPLTPGGKPSVAKGALEALKAAEGTHTPAGKLVVDVLDYRHHETAVSTFLEPWRVLVETGDGRARPTIYTLGADTGRMSCVRPNFQNVPREGGFRPCITADYGHLIISADFSGVELRVMAALSQDPNMIQMLLAGMDIHSLIAAQVFGDGWTKADRYMVKRGVFGWAYGGSVPTLAAQVGCSHSTMAAVVDVLADMAPTYVQWSNHVKASIRSGCTEFPTYAGRVIHLDKRQPHKGPNYAVQGTARELLVDGLLRWDQTKYGKGVVLPVHDEVVAVVPEADAADATAELVRCMTTELYGVPVPVEASTPAFAWADAA